MSMVEIILKKYINIFYKKIAEICNYKFVKLFCLTLCQWCCVFMSMGNENKQMWFASYIRGGEAYDRKQFNFDSIHIILCTCWNDYHRDYLNYSISDNFE